MGESDKLPTECTSSSSICCHLQDIKHWCSAALSDDNLNIVTSLKAKQLPVGVIDVLILLVNVKQKSVSVKMGKHIFFLILFRQCRPILDVFFYDIIVSVDHADK